MAMTLVANGYEYVAWNSISVEASMKEAVRSFTAKVTENIYGTGPGSYFIKPGDEVQIYADNGELLLDGYANKWDMSFAANSHTVTISGRGKGQDSADSSAEHRTGRFENRSAVEIANELGGVVGNVYFSDDTLPKIPMFQLNQGETIHQTARRLAAVYGYTILGMADGRMKFCRAEDDTIGSLGEGFAPLLSMTASLDDSKSHSKSTYKSQLAASEKKYGKDAGDHVASTSDDHKRTRPNVVVLPKSADSATAQKMADWHAARKAGDKAKISAVIQGHTLAGALVEPNKLVFITSAMARIEHDMLIETVTWSQDVSGGTKSSLSFVAPPAYGGKKKGKGKASKSKASTTAKPGSAAEAKSGKVSTHDGYGGGTQAASPNPTAGSASNTPTGVGAGRAF